MKARIFFVLFFLGLTTSLASNLDVELAQAKTPPPTVGVIRWDGWYSNPPNRAELYLAPTQWQYRLPFFAQVLDDGSVTVREDSQAVIDQEIELAHDAGIDYWAFDYYAPADLNPSTGWGDPEYGLHLYLASAFKNDIDFALILLGPALGSKADWNTRTVPRIVYLLQQPTYQKVRGLRPLIYVFNLQSFISQFGSKANARAALNALRQAATAAGLGNPYLVGLAFDPVADAPAIKSLGLDAVSSYSAILTQGGSHQLPYQRLAQANRSFWSRALSTGLKVVAPVSTGWDPRPVGAPRNRNTPFYAQAKPEEIAAHLKSALQWTSAHAKARDANTVLIYAWNEIAEGGWLTPTLAKGNERLEAIGQILNNRAGR